jgi:WhiB family transcriptional regulator, redox-sensing transcriptional regulator
MSEVKYPKTDMTGEYWREKAACQYEDASIFFPSSPYSAAYKQAIAICQRCPVRLQCLQHALDNHEMLGVWGGHLFTSERYKK